MKLLREPLVFFLLAGAVLFLVSRGVDSPGDDASSEIIITRETVDLLVNQFSKTWMRPPTEQELVGLLDDLIDEEILYREALALGLDRDDTMIRRRLRQKMEFITEDVASQVTATDEELESFLEARAESYRIPPVFSFRQIFISTERRAERAREDAVHLLQLLRTTPSTRVEALGDPLPLPPEFEGVSAEEVAHDFGSAFAEAISDMEPGSWQGPVESAFGYHLVRVMSRADGRLPELDEIRDVVGRDFQAARKRETNQALLRALRQKYQVKLDLPEQLRSPGNELLPEQPQ